MTDMPGIFSPSGGFGVEPWVWMDGLIDDLYGFFPPRSEGFVVLFTAFGLGVCNDADSILPGEGLCLRYGFSNGLH